MHEVVRHVVVEHIQHEAVVPVQLPADLLLHASLQDHPAAIKYVHQIGSA